MIFFFFIIIYYLLIVVQKIEISKTFEPRVFSERKLTTNFPCESDQRVTVKQNYIEVKAESISCTHIVTSKFQVLPTFCHVQMSNDPFKAFFFLVFLLVPTKCLGNLQAIWNNCKCTNYAATSYQMFHIKSYSLILIMPRKKHPHVQGNKNGPFWRKSLYFDLFFLHS